MLRSARRASRVACARERREVMTVSTPVPTTMRATVLVAPHRFELQERPVPTPGPEDVLVRVRACGV
jgi:L-iditol 2-dehydrogenase